MIRIIDKHILTNFLRNLILCIGMFTCIFIIVDIFDRLDDFVSKKIPIMTILTFYWNYVPVIFVTIASPASLVSALYVLGAMVKHNEISALKSSGVSAYRIMLPILIAGLCLWGILFLINEQWVPKANATWQYMTKFEFQSVERKKTKKVTNFGFSDTRGNLFFLEQINPYTKELSNITILSEDPNGEVTQKITAPKGTWEDRIIVLETASIYDYTQEMHPTPYILDHKNILMDQPSRFYIRFGDQSEFMNRKRLRKYIRTLSRIKTHLVPGLMVDYHSKIAYPFSSFLILLIGVFCAFQNRNNKGGALVSVGLSGIMFFSYFILLSLSTASGKGGLIPPLIAAWIPNSVLFVVAIITGLRVKT